MTFLHHWDYKYLNKITGMKYIKPLNEGRPMFQDTPNEFAYLRLYRY